MSEYIHKSHNVSVLLYHFVCPAKYRKMIFSQDIDMAIKDICIEIGKRYDMNFIEIGTDQDHVHFLIQSVPALSPFKIIEIVKSITAKEIFKKFPEVKTTLWGGEFWSKGYFSNTVGAAGCESAVARYVREQGREKEYKNLHKEAIQMSLF
ncbi:MAG: IS200/IS605 family transposase [Chitinispirillaceae bacterium]|jgi:putative transposase